MPVQTANRYGRRGRDAGHEGPVNAQGKWRGVQLRAGAALSWPQAALPWCPEDRAGSGSQ